MNIIEHPRLYRLLGSASSLYQTQWQEVEDEVWKMFGQEAVVLVTDMSYFTQVTNELGIVYYLSMIKKMQDIISMSVPRYNGNVINFVADNSFSIFTNIDDAVSAIIEINDKMAQINSLTPEARDINVCAGIDYGKFLNINGKCLYGASINFACVLGEDIAEPQEVLLSNQAHALIKKTQHQFKQHTVEFNELTVQYHKLIY
ncbi:MAG: hypothetical protein OQK09_08150 [Colwellia sp.]|nr:hypothetical protein [Colwellia sp.]MCW8863806.1 hypothetical protein [Colwellia sp.]MCW9081471.1 hypothetical protein [Colwellia sp.]